MKQKLEVNLTIPIPDDSVLIKKVDLERLQEEELSGVWWSMKDLEKRINRKQLWIKENILFPSKFRKILDIENGGFVFYPRTQGQTWAFQANKMAQFLDNYFSKIFV